jgi:hypothetical protein
MKDLVAGINSELRAWYTSDSRLAEGGSKLELVPLPLFTIFLKAI